MKEHQGKRIGILRIDHPLRITVGRIGISKAHSASFAMSGTGQRGTRGFSREDWGPSAEVLAEKYGAMAVKRSSLLPRRSLGHFNRAL